MSSRIDRDRQLQKGDTFRSDNNEYALVFQDDGNFVLYNGNGEATWNSGTYGSDAQTIIVQGDGNVVMYDSQGGAIWASNSNYEDAQNPYLKIQDDGNVVLYDDGKEGAFWSTSG